MAAKIPELSTHRTRNKARGLGTQNFETSYWMLVLKDLIQDGGYYSKQSGILDRINRKLNTKYKIPSIKEAAVYNLVYFLATGSIPTESKNIPTVKKK